MKIKVCESCKKEMECLGNIDGIVYTSYPEQWKDVYVCHNCKTKKEVWERGSVAPSYTYLKDYKSIT